MFRSANEACRNVKYVGCFQDTVYQDPSHLYVRLLHKEMPTFQPFVSFAQRQVCTTMTNAVLRRFGFLLMVPCGEKHVGILTVILYYKYLRNKFFPFCSFIIVNLLSIMHEINNKFLLMTAISNRLRPIRSMAAFFHILSN